MHEAFTVPLDGILWEHVAESVPLTVLPHLHDAKIERFEERTPDLGRELRCLPVLSKTVRQRTAS
ncbi:hypothetical protein D3C73_1272590 [compost metagenome]